MAEEALGAEGDETMWIRRVDYAVVKEFDERGQLVSTQYLDDGTATGTKRSGNNSSCSSGSNKAARPTVPVPPTPVGAVQMSAMTPAHLPPAHYGVMLPQRSSHFMISRIELDEMCDNFHVPKPR